MEYLSDLLPIIIYMLLIVLIILLIVISVKVIKALNKIQGIVDNVDKKVSALDGLFEVVETASNKLSSFGDKVINIISGAFQKVFKPSKKDKIKEDE